MSQIQQTHKDKLELLKMNMDKLKSELPVNKYRCSKVFEILPGYKVDNQFQYPDMMNMTQKSFSQLQPMQLGLNQFSMMA